MMLKADDVPRCTSRLLVSGTMLKDHMSWHRGVSAGLQGMVTFWLLGCRFLGTYKQMVTVEASYSCQQTKGLLKALHGRRRLPRAFTAGCEGRIPNTPWMPHILRGMNATMLRAWLT